MNFNAIVGSFVAIHKRKNATTSKMLRVMKLTAILLFIACIHVSAHGLGQELVTFSGNDVPLEKVFSAIKKQTSYLFLYNDAFLKNARAVTINVKNASVKEVMDACTKDQPFDYNIEGKTIFIVKRLESTSPPSTKEVVLGGKELPEVKGRITNASGEPLNGANIVVKRTGKGTQANANGEFILKNVDQDEALVISYTGYAAQTVKISGRTNLMLVMQLAENELDETIVQAYGTTTRRLATSNIAKVTAAEIERQPVMNPLLALQGKVAGLDVTQTNGFASAPIKVELRGRNTIGINPNQTFPSDPLYIIDGVPLTVLEIGGSSSYKNGSTGFIQTGFNGPARGQSPLFSVNPSDIESIEVLKDADATAIYGSRGANGVILITTKKGKAGKGKFDLHIQQGVNKQIRFWDLMNISQYLKMRREALINDGITPSLRHGDYDLVQWDTTRNTDWQRALYGNSGKTLDAQASLSGGNERVNFRIGAGYNRTTNILTVSGADQRGSLNFNVSHRSLNQRLIISLGAGYSISQSDMIQIPSSAIVSLPPNAPPIFDSAGNLNYSGWGGNNTSARLSYPFSTLKQPYTSKSNFINSNLSIAYEPIKGLKLSSSLGFNNSQANQQLFTLIASQDPSGNPTGGSQLGYNTNKNWIVEPQIMYDAVISKGKISVLMGGSLQETNTNAIYVNGNGFTSDALIQSISNASSQSTYNAYGKYKYAAVFGRISYNWRNEYVLSLNGRRDGSSRFGSGKQYGNFGSIGGGWIFTEENWFKNIGTWLSFGKIRGSYGITGSDAIGDYKYLTRWSSDGTLPYNGISSLVPIQHANGNFQWQVNKKLEGAIDLGFLKDRISISIAYYRDRCGNQLVDFPTPALSGFTSVAANSPAMVENSGWEFVSGSKIISSKNFRLSINFNMAINRNKLIAYPNIELSPYINTLVIGKPLNIIKLYHYTGVDPSTGEYTFEDRNHDSTYDMKDYFVYDLSPKFFGGFGMNLSYKSVQLSLFFNFKKQIGQDAIARIGQPGQVGNQPGSILGQEWQKTGDIATIAQFTTQPPYSNSLFKGQSDGVYTDASYIRLSNVSLSYNLPDKVIKKAGLQGCSFFFHTNNLFVLTRYRGVDPETQNFGSMPPSKTLVLGINFNL